jgi:hypothetical protein
LFYVTAVPGLLNLILIFGCGDVYFSLPLFLGLPFNELAKPTLDPDAKALLLYKFGIVRHLIAKSNVAVWCPSSGRLNFSLPQEFSEVSHVFSCMTVSIPATEDR